LQETPSRRRQLQGEAASSEDIQYCITVYLFLSTSAQDSFTKNSQQ